MPAEPNPFYPTLSRYYDALFPLEPVILSFLKDTFHGCSRILDVACGTGTYTLPLWEEGKRIVGVDLDPSMIQQARQKVMNRLSTQGSSDEKSGTGAQLERQAGELGHRTPEDFPDPRWIEASRRFLVDDMRTLSSFREQSFEGIYCIGNSLVHLQTLEEIQTTLKRFAQLLVPEGTLVIQIVNFDRVNVQSQPYYDLPTLRGEGVKLTRRYTPGPDPDHVFFETELSAEGNILQNRLPMYRLSSEQLKNLLSQAGFGHVQGYGSYGKDPYEPARSFLLIVSAKRVGSR